MKCWICGDEAKTGEHKIKKSDLKASYGHISQSNPLYLNSSNQKNLLVKGLNVDTLKFKKSLCAKCNNERTQRFDKSWETFFKYILGKSIYRENYIELDRIFPNKIQESMLNIHLYFVKLLGCIIHEYSLPFEISEFSNAILNNVAHQKVHIAFCPSLTKNLSFTSVGYSDFKYDFDDIENKIVFAIWYLDLDKISVRIMFVEPNQPNRNGLFDSWHPSNISKNLYISSY